jgi:hypothetical protein
MMAEGSFGQQHTTLAQQFLPASVAQQYLPASSLQQLLFAPSAVLMLGSSHTPIPSGAYWVTHAPTPTPSVPTWAPTQSGIQSLSPSSGVQGAYSMPSIDSRDRSDVVTGTISVDSFDAYVLFDSGASFSFVSEGFVGCTGISVQ